MELCWLVCLSWFSSIVVAQSSRNCFNFDDSCSACIQQPKCQWCSKLKESSNANHCFSKELDYQDFCDDIENPKNSGVEILQNSDFTEVKKNQKIDYDNIVQLKPQRIKLKMRKGVPKNITLTYRQVSDYPLDLYYLMDLSASMYEDKNQLESLGKELAEKMRNLTSQFKIGFGSFVDKVLLPYTNTKQESLNNPCRGRRRQFCASPFSYRNNLPLTENDNEFTKKVGDAQISSNNDSPEGGFDALMQAMVCKEKVGWRDNVRKILVFSTDASFHMAGDGKLAGAIEPNDKKCHLNSEGLYDKFDVYDYPSIGQIAEVAQQGGFNLIFAVKGHTDLYKDLADRIKGASYGQLTFESSNVVQLVADVYDSITSQVEISEKSNHEIPVSIRYFSTCGGEEMSQTHACSGVKEGKTLTFNVELTVKECPKYGSPSSTQLEIGTLQDSLIVDIELLCDCKCELSNHTNYEKNSKSCTERGTKQCDVCVCNDKYYGKECQCSRSEEELADNKKSDLSKCKPDGANSSTLVCNGRGQCECEICDCWNKNFGGKFCQCNREMCLSHLTSEVECSGHGKCDCNECICNPGWEGKYCQCEDDQSCIAKGEKKYCSGNGECSCGACECKFSYMGRYCEECPSCEAMKCLEFQPCVQCDVWKSGPLTPEECKNNCTLGKITQIHSLEGPLRDLARLCQFMDESTECNFNFTYKYNSAGKRYIIYAQDRQECPEKIDVLAVSFGVVLSIVAIGILTLIIWKVVTTIHDKRECAEFEKETKDPAWGTNESQVYVKPVVEVQNPMFIGDS